MLFEGVGRLVCAESDGVLGGGGGGLLMGVAGGKQENESKDEDRYCHGVDDAQY